MLWPDLVVVSVLGLTIYMHTCTVSRWSFDFQGDELKKQVALVKAIAEFLLDSQIPAFVSNIVRIIYAGHLIKTLLNSIAASLVTKTKVV